MKNESVSKQAHSLFILGSRRFVLHNDTKIFGKYEKRL